MTNTAPISNVLNIKIANYLDDPLTAAADNGLTAATNTSTFLASQRNQALNEALAWVVNECVNRYGLERTREMIPGAVSSQAFTANSNGVTLNGDFMYALEVIKGTTRPPFTIMSKADLTLDSDILVTNAAVIEGGKIYVYIRTAGTLAIQSTGSYTLFYLKADRKSTTDSSDTAVNTLPDTTLDYRFLDATTWYACHLLAQAKGAGEWMEKSQHFLALAMEKFPK